MKQLLLTQIKLFLAEFEKTEPLLRVIVPPAAGWFTSIPKLDPIGPAVLLWLPVVFCKRLPEDP